MKILSIYCLRKISSVFVFSWIGNYSERFVTKIWFTSFVTKIKQNRSHGVLQSEDWVNINAVFFKKQRKLWNIYQIFSKCNSNRFVMKDDWNRKWIIGCCNLLWWYILEVEVMTWTYLEVLLSSWISVSGTFICCNNWITLQFLFLEKVICSIDSSLNL